MKFSREEIIGIAFSLLIGFLLGLMACFFIALTGCGNDPNGLHRAIVRDAGRAGMPDSGNLIPDTGSFDIHSNFDADVDAGPDGGDPFHPPPVFDGGSSAPSQCLLWGPMIGVPCVRWAPGASCWFLSNLDPDDFDLLCEDDLPLMAWCQCFGFDWINDQGLPCCLAPF